MAPPNKLKKKQTKNPHLAMTQAEMAVVVANVQNNVQYLYLLGQNFQMKAAQHADHESQRATAFVNSQVQQYNLRMFNTVEAIEVACADYNRIMRTEASKHIDITGLALFVAFTLMPEVGALGVAIKALSGPANDATKKVQAIIGGLKTAGKLTDLRKFAAGKSGTEAKGLGIECEVIQQWYDACNYEMAVVTNLSTILCEGIIEEKMPDAFQWITNQWAQAKLETLQVVDPSVIQQATHVLSAAILYELLRWYTKTYVVVEFVSPFHINGPVTRSVLDKLSNAVVDEVHGLNDNQRELIYQRFSSVPWTNPSRPPLNSWRDLITVWEAKVDN